MSLSRQLLEVVEDDNFMEDEDVVSQLVNAGCFDFIKNEVKTFVDSSLTNTLGLNVEAKYEFLKGSIYGYTFGKTSDRKLSVSAGKLATSLAKKYKNKK